METAIVAIGTANPAYRQQQQEAAELIATVLNLNPAEKRLLKSVYKATGIEYRYSVMSDFCSTPDELRLFPREPEAPFPSTAVRMQVYKENALKLALLAIENCLAMLDSFDKSKITHLITISCTGMYAPGIDIEIIQTLGLNSTTQRTMVNFMGCYAAFSGMKLADAICKANPDANVLIVSVELCTIHFQKSMRPDNMISNAIFADGAAAVLFQAKPTQKKYFNIKSFYCDLLPQTNQEMAWHITDYGFDMVLSSYVPKMIESGIADFVDKLLTQSGTVLSAIDLYAIHPGGLKILQACEKALNIDQEQNKYSYQIMRNYGNMSSATILFTLKAIWEDISHLDNNKNIFSCAFGPGLTLESMLLQIQEA